MKYKKILLLTLAIPFAASCGGGNLTQIKDDETAKNLVNEMVKRQADKDLFQLPNKFTLKQSHKKTTEANTAVGTTSSSETTVSEINFDLDNLIYRKYEKTQKDKTSVEYEEYGFFNNDDGNYYVCINSNGYKHRIENSSTTDAAKQTLISLRTNYKGYICGEDLTYNFENRVKKYSEQHEKYKNEKDQHFNYTFGSNDAKSFQIITDCKLKEKEGDYEGYAVGKYNGIIKDDLCISITENTEIEAKDTTGQFYVKEKEDKSSSGSYGNTSISRPNIKDYIK